MGARERKAHGVLADNMCPCACSGPLHCSLAAHLVFRRRTSAASQPRPRELAILTIFCSAQVFPSRIQTDCSGSVSRGSSYFVHVHGKQGTHMLVRWISSSCRVV